MDLLQKMTCNWKHPMGPRHSVSSMNVLFFKCTRHTYRYDHLWIHSWIILHPWSTASLDSTVYYIPTFLGYYILRTKHKHTHTHTLTNTHTHTHTHTCLLYCRLNIKKKGSTAQCHVCTVTRCNAVQQTATQCSSLQHTATQKWYMETLQSVGSIKL